MLVKIFIGFIIISSIETLNGIFRIRVLLKKFDKNQAKIISFLLGSSIVIMLNFFLIPWIEPKNISEAFFIGFIWMGLMLSYDLYIGRVLFKLSWEKIMEDFNIRKGNLLGIGMVLILLLPIAIGFYLNIL